MAEHLSSANSNIFDCITSRHYVSIISTSFCHQKLCLGSHQILPERAKKSQSPEVCAMYNIATKSFLLSEVPKGR